MEMRFVLLALGAIVAIALSLKALAGMTAGIETSQVWVGTIPVTIFRAAGGAPAPVVVIAHGFAGSQQLMQPLAVTLARNGFVAVTFDFAGHGRNSQPLPGGIADLQRSTRALLDEIGEVVAFARQLPGVEPKLALVGHSMASDLVVKYAIDHQDIDATVAFSLFGQDVTPTHPRNLIVIDGAWEAAMLKDQARRIVAAVADGEPRERVTYGDLMQGMGRRFVFAKGAEHIGVIYSRDGLEETLRVVERDIRNARERLHRPARPLVGVAVRGSRHTGAAGLATVAHSVRAAARRRARAGDGSCRSP